MINPKRIEKGLWWNDAWRLTTGCTKVSAGCVNCWAEHEANIRKRQDSQKIATQFNGTFDGKEVRFLPQNLEKPLKRKKPTVYAVWNDLFHEAIDFEDIDKAFAVMALCPEHRFIILTKRPEMAVKYFQIPVDSDKSAYMGIRAAMWRFRPALMNAGYYYHWPLPNVIIGTSVEDQTTANERIPHLLKIPAASRMVSYEPALGPVDFTKCEHWGYNVSADYLTGCDSRDGDDVGTIDWVIMGSESGKSARPCKNEWVESAYDQCRAAGIPFFLKQWTDQNGKIHKAPKFAVSPVDMDLPMGSCLELPEVLK